MVRLFPFSFLRLWPAPLLKAVSCLANRQWHSQTEINVLSPSKFFSKTTVNQILASDKTCLSFFLKFLLLRVNRKWMLYKLGLCFLSWFLGSFSVYMQRLSLILAVFVINGLLAWILLVAHVSARKKVWL